MSNYITIPLSKTGKHAGKYEAIVDAIDADLEQFNWIANINYRLGTVYAHRMLPRNGKQNRTLRLHRVILARKLGCDELLPTEYVDHIDGNPLNNRRENLRLATPSQNVMNARKRSNNKSGYKGVYWKKQSKKWAATIRVNGKGIHLGYFDNIENAKKAYQMAADKHFEDYANYGEE